MVINDVNMGTNDVNKQWEAGQLDYARNHRRRSGEEGEEDPAKDDDDDWLASSRAGDR